MITLTSYFMVLIAAFLHALWNSLVKTNEKKSLVVFLISLVHLFFGIVLSFFSLFPELSAWPYLIVSTVVHLAYLFFLYQSYKWGDLSEVYPLMRGIAPLIVTLGAFLFIGELTLIISELNFENFFKKFFPFLSVTNNTSYPFLEKYFIKLIAGNM